MARLQQAEGLTEEQQELLSLVRAFVDERILPVATALEHADGYPPQSSRISGIINTRFIVAYLLLQHGSAEQKQRYLPRMATGESAARSR